MALSVGTKAPDFSLKSKQASGLVDVKLSNHFGKRNTLLLFFPLAFTSVCTQEMCDVTSGLNAYSSLNAEVIGVSVDSPFSQEAWAQKEKIGITLASDLNKETAKAYGTLLPDLIGLGAVSSAHKSPVHRQLTNRAAMGERLRGALAHKWLFCASAEYGIVRTPVFFVLR